MRKYSFLIFVVFLFSCTGDPMSVTKNGDFQLELLFEKDGCKVYRFRDGGRYIYWSSCDGRASYSYTVTSGKSTTTHHVESITSKPAIP